MSYNIQHFKLIKMQHNIYLSFFPMGFFQWKRALTSNLWCWEVPYIKNQAQGKRTRETLTWLDKTPSPGLKLEYMHGTYEYSTHWYSTISCATKHHIWITFQLKSCGWKVHHSKGKRCVPLLVWYNHLQHEPVTLIP
jgi:hypothetical protein